MKAQKMLLVASAGLALASITAQITLASSSGPRREKAASRRPGLEPVAYKPGASDDWTTHRFALFTIRTPASWSAKGPIKDLYDAALGTYLFEDARGGYFAVNIDPYGSDFSADSVWRYRVSGNAFSVDPAGDCTPSEEDPFCSVGDRRLDIYAVSAEGGSAEVGGHQYYFAFGDTAAESAERAVFEKILESIRIR
jgi:hypothetical protein